MQLNGLRLIELKDIDRSPQMTVHNPAKITFVNNFLAMSIKDEHDETLNRFEKAVEASKAKFRRFLMEKNKEERFRIMREDFSMNVLETLCEWALPDEDYEICATVEQVKANNTADFKVRFEFEDEMNNKAHVVRFEGADGTTYYHADYILHDEDDGWLVMLHRQEDGSWYSEWRSSDARLFQPIGEAIERWEECGATGEEMVTIRLDR
jgi:hypothetical protein